MNDIRVRREALLETVKKNRAQHRAVFEKAVEGYREQMIAELSNMLDEAKQGKRIRRAVALVEPMDQTKEYDRVIRMLEMSSDEIIELSEHDFNCYVMDSWTWSAQFTTSNSAYIK